MCSRQWVHAATVQVAQKSLTSLTYCLFGNQPRTTIASAARYLVSLKHNYRMFAADPRHHNLVSGTCVAAQHDLAAVRHKTPFMRRNRGGTLNDQSIGTCQRSVFSSEANSARKLAAISRHHSMQHCQQQASLACLCQLHRARCPQPHHQQPCMSGCLGGHPVMHSRHSCRRGQVQAHASTSSGSGSQASQYHSSSGTQDSWAMSQELQEHWEKEMRDLNRSEVQSCTHL